MPTIAIIGRDRMAAAHAAAWSQLGLGPRIRYVCAPGALPNAAPLENAPAARAVTELDDVLRDPEIDIVCVCTPTPTHAEIATRCLNAGKNVLLEKPIALTLTVAAAIRDSAARSDGLLMVAHVVRFFGGYRALRSATEGDDIGRVLFARAERISDVPAPSPWWHDESKSGGVLVDFAIHDFDQLNLFLGEPVTASARRVGAEGPYDVTVEYGNGSIGRLLSFMAAPAGVPFTSALELLGTDGLAEHRFVGTTESGAPGSDAAKPDAARPQAVRNGDSIRILTTRGERIDRIEPTNPYATQAAHFLECVERGAASTIAPTDAAVCALAVSLAARDSLSTGRPVSVSEC